MEGFYFRIKNNYYFIETNSKRKTKTIAKEFLDYFSKKYEGYGFIPLSVMAKTFNKIYNEMQLANIQLSNDKKAWFIHEKNAGATIDFNELIIVKEVK